MTDIENQDSEYHLVKTARFLVSEERKTLGLQVITRCGKNERNIVLEFRGDGAPNLLKYLQAQFEEHPDMADWTGPLIH